MALLLFPLSGSGQARLASIEQAIRLTTDVDSGCIVQGLVKFRELFEGHARGEKGAGASLC
jgi:hypothetical protein